MSVFKDGEMKKKYAVILSLLLVGAWFALVYYKTGIYFETNDDRVKSEILGGVLTGMPEAHERHSNYLLSCVYTLLYRITTQVPWYGLGMIGMLGLSFFLISKNFLMHSRKLWQSGAVLALAGAFMLAHFYVSGLIQFTSAASFLAMAGYVSLILNPDKKGRWIEFLLASSLAYCLRSDGMLMVQPLGLAVYGGILLMAPQTSLRDKINGCAAPVLGVVVILAVGGIAMEIGYGGEEWQDYLRYEEARQVLFDYAGKPSYEEVRDILDKYEVSEAAYQGYLNYVLLDWEISPDCAQELAAYAKGQQEPKAFGSIPEELWQNLWLQDYWGMNRTAVILAVLVLVLLLVNADYRMLLPFGALEAVWLLMWSFLLYRGRTPKRVTVPLLACEVLLLLVIVVLSCLRAEADKGRRRGVTLLLLSLFLCWSGVRNGRAELRYVKQQNDGQEIFMKGMWELEDYCRSHPENRYLLESVSMSFYNGSALETETFRKRNSMVTGNWFSNAPMMQEALWDYLESADGGIYFILSENGNSIQNPAVIYLAEKTGAEPVVADQITASHGGVYTVYYYDGKVRIRK